MGGGFLTYNTIPHSPRAQQCVLLLPPRIQLGKVSFCYSCPFATNTAGLTPARTRSSRGHTKATANINRFFATCERANTTFAGNGSSQCSFSRPNRFQSAAIVFLTNHKGWEGETWMVLLASGTRSITCSVAGGGGRPLDAHYPLTL